MAFRGTHNANPPGRLLSTGDMDTEFTNAPDLRSPGSDRPAPRVVTVTRERLAGIGARTQTAVRQNADSLAAGLGWFAVGLGLAQIAMPDRVARIAGIEPTADNLRVMRTMGMRELTSGVGILTQPVPDKWLWGRVLGDVMDLALLGVAMGKSEEGRGRTIGATLAVLGVTGLDILAAKELSRKRGEMEAGESSVADAPESRHPIGEKTIFRILTIKAHPANVEGDWNDWVLTEGGDESRSATVTFAAAPGGRGTEVRAELSYTPKAGKLGTVAQKLTHKSPGQMLGQDLKRFKMLVETGEIAKSDASIHKHMHPARPDDTLGNANLIQEEAR